jgi:hypothetical protein
MSAKKLLAHFGSQTHLPVKLQSVLTKIKQHSGNQRFVFAPFEEDETLLGGMINRWSVTLGWDDEPTIINKIFYNRRMPPEMQRLVVCKETLHVFDPSVAITDSEADVDDLIKHMSRWPLDLSPTPAEFEDRLVTFQALAILLPWGAREALLSIPKERRPSETEIAALARLPVGYTALVMSEEWPTTYQMICNRAAMHDPDDAEAAE